MPSSLQEEEKFQDKFEYGDKGKIMAAVQENLDGLATNHLAAKNEVKAKQMEIEGAANPMSDPVLKLGD